uniref:melanoma antigen preferentially expressed in tumors-like n=1 Tax=Callithrix jacchus TaxID=9483 RepID=UPI0004F01226|nr:melanoma antigen preferentially expressed in tumors-like [Callithrix jacchus]XP_054107174.1 melanoma antigen preferentially expressed in tumors-like [Callithrix jacchus]
MENLSFGNSSKSPAISFVSTVCVSLWTFYQRHHCPIPELSGYPSKLLSLSNNQMSWEVSGSFLALLEKVSGTLEHLEVDNCLITDFTFSVVTPALSHCSHLCVPSFVFNPITMPVLTSPLQHLTAWMELKYVIYPVPVHGYEQWRCCGSLDMKAC